ncbi:hypothetical protein FK220_005285 [Flavobacteriaceae bacterium TP-CH-4]|uniref:Metallo-beta-lactamase domain-containing protein n=1 Tax=Pelagihabitans pacificus TaxID=2696054 RepID=A0A967E4U2_9FLAO|nr:MBL fold metallo-hydrolase [Pelagihabitans pacificus]NHF58742.1 hypothetical protein [Pelagihabitans pacificus]
MRKLKKILKKMGMFFLALVVFLVIVAVLFLNFSPQFGGTPNEADRTRFTHSENYKEGVFVNRDGVTMEMGFDKFFKSLTGYFSPQPNTKPERDLSVEKIDSLNIADYEGPTRMIWFGHSTFLLQMNGKILLIDPMFGLVPAPHPWLGANRFSAELPIAMEKLPKIDAVIFSHDHYDHLDYGSVQLLKDKVARFYVPLGVGAHLREWGVSEDIIVESDWWDEIQFQDLKFICAPAQHFSGRGLNDRGKTLWCSWIIQSTKENIFFSGDSGYGLHFKEIGAQYGPFDFAMMECGQYNELWKEIHMMPEETVQAGIDVQAQTIMPIHWGSFKLAMHPWTEPVERLTQKANELGIPWTVPKIGEPIYLNGDKPIQEDWWTNF